MQNGIIHGTSLRNDELITCGVPLHSMKCSVVLLSTLYLLFNACGADNGGVEANFSQPSRLTPGKGNFRSI